LYGYFVATIRTNMDNNALAPPALRQGTRTRASLPLPPPPGVEDQLAGVC